MSDILQSTIEDGIRLVEINQPARKNAVSLGMWRALTQVFRQIAAEPQTSVVILAGVGDSFSSGADITEFNTVRSNEEQATAYEAAVDEALATIRLLPKPTIAAISGICYGGGAALAASTDFRIADATAQFSISAVRMGLAYNVDKCARLIQLVGLSAAKRILLTGQRFDAQQAERWGYVDETTTGKAIDAAIAMAKLLRQGAPLAQSSMKLTLEALAAGAAEADRDRLNSLIRLAELSADHREAVRAFAEKRPPAFRGH